MFSFFFFSPQGVVIKFWKMSSCQELLVRLGIIVDSHSTGDKFR